jgi:type IX secretion system PorP/SprF family membrane protein
MMKATLKKIFLMVLVFGHFTVSSAQGFVPIFNEYLAENLYMVHPAMIGVNLKNARINLGSRQQWFNVPDAPGTNLLTLEYKATKNAILGLQLIKDHNGYHSKNSNYLTFGYRIYLSDAIWNTRRSFPTKNDNIKELSFGINIGSINYSIDQSSFDARIPDPLLNANSSGKRYFTIDAGAAYVSTHLSAQVSVKNINMNSTQGDTADGDVYINPLKFKHYLASLQYEIFFNNGWNLEPSFLVQFLEKTEESSLDLNLKLYRLVKKGRIWLGASFRQNFIKIDTPSEYTIPNQNYTHFTPVFGMNYDRYLFSYHYTSNLGTLNLGTSGLHYFSLGITLF